MKRVMGAGGTYETPEGKFKVPNRKDPTNTLSKEATGWLYHYQWGSGVDKNPIPSDKVILELSKYVTKSQQVLYRFQLKGVPHDSNKLIESWSKYSGESDFIAENMPGHEAVRKIFQPHEIIVDTTRLPKRFLDTHDAGTQFEVIIAKGALAARVKRLRSTKASTVTIKSITSMFRWDCVCRYQDRKFVGVILAPCYQSAVEKSLHTIIEEWFGEDDQTKFKSLAQYLYDNPSQLSVKMKDSLESIAKRYALTQKYYDPGAALSQCKKASNTLARFLQTLGYDTRILKCTGPKANTNSALPKWRKMNVMDWIHHVVETNDSIIDLTARQFNPDAPYPMLMTRWQLEQLWADVEDEYEDDKDGINRS